MKTRTPWQVTRSVWYALFLREAIARTMADRMSWFWMLAEPIAMMVIMVGIRAVAFGGGHIGGAGFIEWMIVGFFGFMLFRENMMRPIGAIGANQALFGYRQVKPIDPVLVRSYLEGMLKTFIFLLFILAGILLEFDMMPDEPLGALFDWGSLWALGLGAGLVLSVLSSLVPEVGRVVQLTSFPLLMLSGVMFPLNFLPYELQQILLLNPIVHGLESLRANFFGQYRPVSGISLTYLWYWALSLFTLGLTLHIRFEQKLKAR